MALDNYDASTSKTAYYPSGSDRPARLWATEHLLHTLAELGIVDFFEGAGTNPTTLTGYAIDKLWLNVSAGVTQTSGVIRVYAGSGSASSVANWPELTRDRFSAGLNDSSAVVGSAASHWTEYYTTDGTAKVSRANRILIGASALASSDIPLTTSDWVDTLLDNVTAGSQMIATSTVGVLGVTGAARSSDYRTWAGAASGGSQGVTGIGYNDDLTGNPIAAGIVGICVHANGCTGVTLNQFDTNNIETTPVDATPHGDVAGGQTYGLGITAGAYADLALGSVSAGMYFGAGVTAAAVFRKGILFFEDALDITLGSGGAGIAMEYFTGQSQRWLNTSDQVDAEFWGNANGGFTFASRGSVGSIFTYADNTASGGPYVQLDRFSTTPAANDAIGGLLFQGRDSAGNSHQYLAAVVNILDPTNGSEDAEYVIAPSVGGASANGLRVANGVQIGAPTGGYTGTGTINATGYYLNGGSLTALFGEVDASNTWTAEQTITGASDSFIGLNVVSTSASSSISPVLALDRESASPAANDIGGMLLFRGRDTAANLDSYAAIAMSIADPTSGSEDGYLSFWTNSAGAGIAAVGYFGQGFVVGAPTGSDKGAGKVNAVEIYENGTALNVKYGEVSTGTATIGAAFGGASVGVTYTSNSAYWIRTGNTVTVNGSLQLSSKGSSTGQFSITGLPFTVGSLGAACVGYYGNFAAGITTSPSALPGATSLTIWKDGAGAASALLDTDCTNTTRLDFSVTYNI